MTRTPLSLLLTPCLMLCGIAQAAEISSCQDLQNIPTNSTAYYTFTQDIDCSGIDFRPIPYFLGVLDGDKGNGERYTISNLTINAEPNSGKNAGLFERILGNYLYADKTTQIKNLHFINAAVYSDTNTYRGLLAGSADYSLFENITVKGLIVTGNNTGGNHPIAFEPSTGGLVGYTSYIDFSNIALHNVTLMLQGSEYYAGGIVGQEWPRSGVTNLGSQFKQVSVTNLSIDAKACDHDLNEVYSCGAGGLIGQVSGSGQVGIEESAVIGKIYARYNAGGLIGHFPEVNWAEEGLPPTIINNSYTDVLLESDQYAGGLIGNAPNNDNVKINMSYVYAAGPVNVKGEDGGRGMVGNKGKSSNRVLTTEGYFDKDNTGKEYSGDRGSQRLSVTKMMDPATYATWNTDIWCIAPNIYPSLRYQQYQGYCISE